MDLFEQFTAPSQEQWLSQIKRELKDMPMEGMLLEEGIVAQAYLHPDTQPNQSTPLWSEPIDWAICADFDLTSGVLSAPSANAKILEALAGGVTGIRLIGAELEQLPELLQGVYLQMVELRIAGETARNPAILKF